jgi:hypothetical protein
MPEGGRSIMIVKAGRLRPRSDAQDGNQASHENNVRVLRFPTPLPTGVPNAFQRFCELPFSQQITFQRLFQRVFLPTPIPPRSLGLEARAPPLQWAYCPSGPDVFGSMTSRWRILEGGPYASLRIFPLSSSRCMAPSSAAFPIPLLLGCFAKIVGA